MTARPIELARLIARNCFLVAVFFAPLTFGLAQAPQTVDPSEAARLAPATPAAPRKASESNVPYTPGEAERFRVLRRTMTPEELAKSGFRLRSLEGFIDYDEVEDIFYGPSRTQVFYGNYFLEADKLIFDNRLQEVQADGNVILKTKEQGLEGTVIHADSMRYNFGEGEGVAFNVHGEHPPIFFKSIPSKNPKVAKLPQFQQVSPVESLFRNTQVTTCDFTVPHYYLRAREVIMFQKDRVFFRSAVLYVDGFPVFYLPYYSRSLTEPSPWFMQFGVNSRTGARLRIGYQYLHESKEPSLENDEKLETRSRGDAQTFVDFLSNRGLGGGFQYKYEFDFGRDHGEFQAYGLEDFEREVSGADLAEDDTGDQSQRWQLYWQHRTEFTKHLYATINVDWFSDPEIFYDVLDHFGDEQFARERPIQRQNRITFTYLREAYVARLLFDVKERIGIDRYNNFSDPSNNNRDFDLEPGVELGDTNANSIDGSRWGRVTERYPEFTFATRYLPLKNYPIYLTTEIKAYNNLDKGLNIVNTRDDARVHGFEFYQQMLWQYQISDRYTLLVKLGGGFGVADRTDDDLGVDFTTISSTDGLVLADNRGTFLVGTKKFNLKDIQPWYAWGDAEVRLNARFSDAMTGFLTWKYRETTRDFIGDFYAQIGDFTSRQDLFYYRLRENMLLASLNYRLVYPNLYAFANAGYNMKDKSEMFPNEQIGYWNTGVGWSNKRETLKTTASVGESRRQLFHPSDIQSGDQDSIFVRGEVDYTPIHGRWYSKVQVDQELSSGKQVEPNGSEDFTFFTDEESRSRLTLLYGRELGPKWDTELRMKWDDQVGGLREVSWILQRDMHDAIASLRLRTRTDFTDATSRTDNKQEFDFTFNIKFKLPNEKVAFGPRDVKTVKQAERQPALAY